MLKVSLVTLLHIPVGVFSNMLGYLSGRYTHLVVLDWAELRLFFGAYSSFRSSIAPSIASGAVWQHLLPRSSMRFALSAWYFR